MTFLYHRGERASSGVLRLWTLRRFDELVDELGFHHPATVAMYGRLMRAWGPERLNGVRVKGLDRKLSAEVARRAAARMDNPGFENRSWRRRFEVRGAE